jgi:FkbH-like protein
LSVQADIDLAQQQLAQVGSGDFGPLIKSADAVATQAPDLTLEMLAAFGRLGRNPMHFDRAHKILQNIPPELAAEQGYRNTRIAVVSNASMKPFVDALAPIMLGHGIRADLWEAPFDQWAQQLLRPDSDLYRFDPSFLVLYLSSLGLTAAGSQLPDETILQTLSSGLARFSSKSSGRIILILPEPLEEEHDPTSELGIWRRNFIQHLREQLGQRVICIEPDPVAAGLGSENWFASRFWYSAKLPCHPNALPHLASHLALTMAHAIALPVKAVAVDMDNTLWGGIVGEDGWEKLHLDPHGSGGPYIRLQAFLKRLREKGILLIGVSKNNEADVREVFDNRPEMVLKWDDFTLISANWRPKSRNIANAAEALNLGLQNFCFLDDSPFEREEVRQALPEVIVPELPNAPEAYLPLLLQSGLFHVPFTTEEDRRRAAMYREEVVRAASQDTVDDLDAFLTSLELRARVEMVDETNRDRVVQLINKTNQFNLTTRRYDSEQVQDMAGRSGAYFHCVRISDRFGESGLTGVLSAFPDAGGSECREYRIDTWLMSCRVMGRTIERAMLAHLVNWLQSLGASRLLGEYLPTAKNSVVAELFLDLGFDEVGEADDGGKRCFALTLDCPYEGNEFVELIEPSAQRTADQVAGQRLNGSKT